VNVQKNIFKREMKLSMVVYTYNPNNWEAKAKGSQLPGQPELYRETLLKRKGEGGGGGEKGGGGGGGILKGNESGL
jgi:hypothetical protein